VRGLHLLTKRDMHRFKKLCEGGHLIPEDYRIYEDWSSINKSQEKYVRIKDGLILEGEVQEMNNEENFYDEGPYEERVRGFFLVGAALEISLRKFFFQTLFFLTANL
jgi:hypothetical protein